MNNSKSLQKTDNPPSLAFRSEIEKHRDAAIERFRLAMSSQLNSSIPKKAFIFSIDFTSTTVFSHQHGTDMEDDVILPSSWTDEADDRMRELTSKIDYKSQQREIINFLCDCIEAAKPELPAFIHIDIEPFHWVDVENREYIEKVPWDKGEKTSYTE